MPIGVEEVGAITVTRRTARLDTAASRRLIGNALGLRTASSSGKSSAGNKATIIMSTPARSKSRSNKKSSTTKSSGRKSKAVERKEQEEQVDQHMDIDEEGTSTFAQVDESIDHLNTVLRRYIPIESSKTADKDESDNNDDAEDVWEHPIKAFGDIQEARERMMDACNKHDEYMRSQQRRDSEEEEEDDDHDEEFRALYMATMTTAFAAELDDIRTGRAAAKASGKKGSKRKKTGGAKGTNASTIMDADNMFVDPPDHLKEDAGEEEEEALVQENIDVEVLVDILQGGMPSFTAKERKMLIEESKRRKDFDDGVGVGVGEGDGEGDIVTPHERRRKMLGF